jgi:Ca2+-binding RTX toxin-like protein
VEGDKFSLQVKASDPDEDDTLSYSAQGLPAGLSIGQETGLISGTIEPGAASGSPYTAKVTVSDGADESAETFEMTVAEPDSPPAPAELEMKPAERMGFGKVEVGKKSTKEVTVTNTGESGGKTIEVSAAEIDGAETFSVSPEKSVELEPGDSHSLEVAFAPKETGVDRAELLIEHTGDNDKLNLSLAGRGVPGAGGCTIMGTDGDDTLRGTAGRDVICGLGGDDKLYGFRGDDVLRGGDGNDRLVGGPGDDRLFGQDGRDFLFGISGEDYANGGRGNDVIRGNQGNDRLVGALGNDVVIGGKDDDTMFGGPGTDKLYGQGGQDRLFGMTGDDYANGGFGNDLIRGNQGNDRLVGATGNDTVIGSEHNDTMFGGPGRDRLFGQEGRDILIIRDGVRGNDSANGGPGPDRCAADPRDRVVNCQ